MNQYDVIVIGAGAAGLFCAGLAGQAGRRVLVVDNGKRPGRKILMSGGGRCNFTNLHASATTYLSHNPHFCKSALARYTPWNFLDLVNRHRIAWHEKSAGQLFCDESAQPIVTMLVSECQRGQVAFRWQSRIQQVVGTDNGFTLIDQHDRLRCRQLVVATGGLSLPGLGATAFGHRLAEQFGLPVIPCRPGLVPLTLPSALLSALAPLAGIATPAQITTLNGQRFREALLFTHRGLSGPVVLQASSYWQPDEPITVNLWPDDDLAEFLAAERREHPGQSLKNTLAKRLPRRLAQSLLTLFALPDRPLKQLTHDQCEAVVGHLTAWTVQPAGTEGYRTAEVTLGGVDCRALSSRTMEANHVPGLYFIGEVMDVTGWLGGYNFQWAWSSAAACASAL